MSEFYFIPRARNGAKLRAQTALTPATNAAPALTLPAAMAARYSAKKDRKPFRPSPQQQSYFDWIETGTGAAILLAVAGAGKTTTLIEGLRRMRGSIFFGAFGKDAAEDIKSKAAEAGVDGPNVRISTLHSAGFTAWRQVYRRVQVDDRKVGRLIGDLADASPESKFQILQARGFLGKLVSFGKQHLLGCAGYPAHTSIPAWREICNHYSLDQDLTDDIKLETALGWAIIVFEKSKQQCPDLIDFDDMIYAPIARGAKIEQNDWFLGDEWQDANPARRELARRMVKPGGRAVFVGDHRQAIFGFAGASADGLAVTAEMFNCQQLALSVTYRCPKAVVNYVRQWVDHIQAHPDAPEGLVRELTVKPPRPCLACAGTGKQTTLLSNDPCPACRGSRFEKGGEWFEQDAPGKEDAILCRYTKPLITTAYAMIRAGIACKVEGRDLGKGLVSICRLWRISTLDKLEQRLAAYLAREIEKARAQDSERREQEITDRVEAIKVFIARCREAGKYRIDDLVAEIESLFGDNITGMVRLSSGHKAKGREWDRVYWLQTAMRGRPKKDWEAVQEDNIKYVIGSRAKQELVLVPEAIHSPAKEKGA